MRDVGNVEDHEQQQPSPPGWSTAITEGFKRTFTFALVTVTVDRRGIEILSAEEIT